MELSINPQQPITNLCDLRTRATSLITPSALDWLEGGASHELTLSSNQQSYSSFQLNQRIFRDVSSVSISSSFSSVTLGSPFIGCPLGGLTQYHSSGEAAVAKGCADAGTLAFISSVSRIPFIEIREIYPDIPLAYQLYLQGDEDWITKQIENAHLNNVVALCVCADAPLRGVRYREKLNGYDARKFGYYDRKSMPPSHHAGSKATWSTLEFIKSKTSIPLIVKGVTHVDDACASIDHGTDMLWISNHGGRVLDTNKSSLQSLLEIRASQPQVPIIFDGGVRSGRDAAIALCLGADFVGIGRPLVYGLALGGILPGIGFPDDKASRLEC